MIKDFNSDNEFSFNYTFMTNADMPILATEKIIENPINPYTGKSIKKAIDKKNIKILEKIVISEEERYTFPKSQYYSVNDDIYNPENWKLLDE